MPKPIDRLGYDRLTYLLKKMSKFLIFCLLCGGCCAAELTMPAIFSDGMVLQRNMPVPLWGRTVAGSTVTVKFAGQSKTAEADRNGIWKVQLDPMDASLEARTLTVSCNQQSSILNRQFFNVFVGEVWLCSGQSNMQRAMSATDHMNEVMADADYPTIRMFLTDRVESLEPLDDCKGVWSVCSVDTIGKFSAVAYFFGRELHDELDVPVGLIRSAMGGTRIETWSPAESLEKFKTVMAYKEREDEKAEEGDETARPWKYYPGKLYNGMIHPLAPYGMRGLIWYQGESNAHSVEDSILYRDLLENLTVSWRALWGWEFPVYAVQLPNYNTPASDGDSWQFMRESVMMFNRKIPNTGMAVAIDVGDPGDIHPGNKRPVGIRLAKQALAHTYGVDIPAASPVFLSAKRRGRKMVVSFDGVGSGLVAKDGEPLRWFTVAGKNREFVPANAVIEGDTVVVSSPEVQRPVAVRYAWDPNPEGCNLYNADGLPAAPFRTDDWNSEH